MLFIAFIIPLSILIIKALNLKMEVWINISEILKNIVNIAFFMVTGVLAYLTYRQAKKSFFSPMKNEIFKKQVDKLEEFKESYGRVTSENDLFTAYRFEEIFIYNWMKIFVKHNNPKDDPNELLEGFRRIMFIELSSPTTTESRIFPRYYNEKEGEVLNLQLSLSYKQISNSIEDVITSNFIPSLIQQKVILLQDAGENILLEITKYLENDIPNMQSITSNNIEGAMNSFKNFNPSKTILYEKYNDCLSTIRNYLNTDKIMN